MNETLPRRERNLLRALKLLRYFFAVAIVLSVFYEQAALSREQWQIPRHSPPPNIGSLGNIGMPPAAQGVPQSMISKVLGSRIPVGTVLTGLIDTDLSSKKSKPGDIFAIVLEDGYVNSGVQVVPRGSRIVGTVVNTASPSYRRGGVPGQLTVALQALVFPDGSSTKFHGFLDYNPAHEQAQEPKTRFGGVNLSDYGQQLKGMIGSFGGGIGWIQNRRMRGNEFKIEAGKQISVKVNRTISLNDMTPPLGSNFVPGLANTSHSGGHHVGAGSSPYPSPANQITNTVRPNAVPGLVGPDPDAPAYKTKPTLYNTGKLTAANNYGRSVPQSSSYSQAMQRYSNGQTQVQPGRPPVELKATPQSLNDPNQIFHQPIGDPLKSLPDPF